MHDLGNGRVMLESHFPQHCKPSSGLHGLSKVYEGVLEAEQKALSDLNRFRKRMKRKRADKRPEHWHVDLENLKAHWHDLHMVRKYMGRCISTKKVEGPLR